jgi:hypothetical protein
MIVVNAVSIAAASACWTCPRIVSEAPVQRHKVVRSTPASEQAISRGMPIFR